MAKQPRAAAARAGWDDHTVADLISQERLRSYLAVTRTESQALRLYEWNGRAAAATLQTVAMVEVIVRNALDRELNEWVNHRSSPLAWFDAVPLDSKGLADLVEARRRATRHGRLPEHHGKVIAELSFGFWRYLTASRYLTALWVPALHRAFAHGPADLRTRRRAVEHHLSDLGFVRNRAAHHEPIHQRDLAADLATAVELGTWISADAGAWIDAQARGSLGGMST